ncbi:FtsB family cell division protein [Streptomyces qinzhouensis]|uniref:Cell division protein FtsL n=1 Tax=Streptomyces qinzhouensis TaxID=2599401 RepID=A0A5B8J8Y8_9ACTN|nr:cell division protein FtsL [Streptomyces qinzhouensis]QDY76331.1 cell division protein FtsL [Streptomyces qinzhouensis]
MVSTAGKQLKGRAARLARLMPAGPSTAARTPFVLLVVVLLGGGLITLLLLNSSLNEGSFELSELKRKTTELTDEQQALQRDVDDRSAPDALERRAGELGMVPGSGPAFIDPDGTVRGVPGRASAPPPDPEASTSAAPPETSAASDTAAGPGPLTGPGAPGVPGPPAPGRSPAAPPTAPADPPAQSAPTPPGR